jgi:hypothetical protein
MDRIMTDTLDIAYESACEAVRIIHAYCTLGQGQGPEKGKETLWQQHPMICSTH